VYFGSRADSIPAWKMPNRVAADAPSSAAPDNAATTRRTRPPGPAEIPDSAAPAAPPAASTRAARRYAPPRPVSYGSAVIPMRLVIRSNAASSTATPSSARLRAGPASPDGAASRPSPPAAVAAEPVNTNGISWYPSCQAGTAVSLISAAV